MAASEHSPLLDARIELFKRKDYGFITGQGNRKHSKQEEALTILTGKYCVELLYGGAAGGAKSWTRVS